jgi:hypothetical protein
MAEVGIGDIYIHPVKGQGKVVNIENPATNQWGMPVEPRRIRYYIRYGEKDVDGVFDTDLSKLTKQ